MNAFVGPKVRRYVARLEAALRRAGIGGELHIMASNGGVATAAMVAEKPVLTLLSGPPRACSAAPGSARSPAASG